jgi:UDP-N-acetylglucosamine 2-epimerase (hydrolysing)
MTLSSKHIVFLTSTRADFGKLKSLIKVTKSNKNFDVSIIVTGMHMLNRFGNTYKEVIKIFKNNIIKFNNQKSNDRLETILHKSIQRFSAIITKKRPDMIVVHGDRVESLAFALVGSLNHILTAHVEGGEISGTIDDSIRHAITKLSHIHFTGSPKAKKRILNMGEKKENIYEIGSPDMDIIINKRLPEFKTVKKRYDIKFDDYSILMWHPVTSQLDTLANDTRNLINFLNKLNKNFIIVYPNNDPGSSIIIKEYKKIKSKKFKILRSLRFEHFLSLLKNSNFIIGNSSSAIYEAPMFNVPAINVGNRQHKRVKSKLIKNIEVKNLRETTINNFLKNYQVNNKKLFGTGKSDQKFLNSILKKTFWETSNQKFFNDVNLKR